MLYSLFVIKDNLSRLNTLASRITEKTKEDELETLKGRFYGMAYDLSLAVGETRIAIDDPIFEINYENLMMKIEDVQNSNTLSELKGAINEIIETFDTSHQTDYTVSDMKRYFRDFYYENVGNTQGSFDSLKSLNRLFNSINVKSDRKMNLFFPDCYDGKIISSLESFDKFNAHGNERGDYAFSSSKDSFYKVVKGAIKGSRIQNDAFDVLYCKPFIKFYVDEDDIFALKRQEKDYINDSFKYLRKGGAMVISIPYYRLYRDLCTMIAKNLENVIVVKASDYDFNTNGMVHIIGTKSQDKEINDDIYGDLRRLYDYKNVKSIIKEAQLNYNIPAAPIKIDIFKGSAIDFDEIASILESSNLVDKSLDNQIQGQLKDTVKNPLLPFNIGQLGLVLTSGCLDGIVDEGDGNKHLIKGRVSKQVMSVEVESDGGIDVTETTVNKVEINVMLPNGEYRTLA